METFSALLAICAGNSPVTGWFPSQRPVTRSFDVFFDLRLNKRLGKQSWGWWFETPSSSLWRHCNEEHKIKKLMGDAEDESATPLLQPTLVMKLSLVNFAGYGWHFVCDGKYYIASLRETVDQCSGIHTLIARFMGPTWDPSGADRTQVGPILAPWTLLSG